MNIIIKKIKEKDEFFNSDRFLEEFNQEKYFELLKAWKTDVEKSYLDENWLLHFSPVRHEKCLMSKRRPCIRFFLYFMIYLRIILDIVNICFTSKLFEITDVFLNILV